MKKILIYTTFDEESMHAIKYGVEMALKENLGVEILHVINTAHYGPDFMATGDEFTGGSYISSAIKQNTITATVHFKEITDELKAKFTTLPEIHTNLKTGIDTKVVVDETKQKDVLMLIFPGFDKGEFFDFITDIRPVVISQARCPILLIPEEVSFKPFNTIIYATDFEQEDTEAMKKLAEIARPFNTDILVMHVTSDKDFTEKIKEEGFTDLIRKETGYDKISFYPVNDTNVEEAIINFSEEKQADIIAVLRENKNFLEKIFKKSTSKRLMKKSSIPVLIFHKQ